MNVIKRISKRLKNRALIQGGSFRLDHGSTNTEINSFRLAIRLYDETKRAGKIVSLGCIVNDLGLNPDQRPKKTGTLEWPKEYLELLQEAKIPLPEIRVDYESSLRNAVSHDIARKKIKPVTAKEHPVLGVPTITCPPIMGKYYQKLAHSGYTQQVGFYTQEPRPADDNSCSVGPTIGATYHASGYHLEIEVLNYWVHPDGQLSLGGHFEAEKQRGETYVYR
jgi:hypothetical protein